MTPGAATFVGDGPASVIITPGILRPDNVTRELLLDSYFPFSGIDEMKANTGWDLKVSPNVKVVPEPTADELRALRSVDSTGMLKKK